MKTFRKMLCVMLSIFMAFGCLSMAVSAEGGETVSSSLKYYTEKSDSYNAAVVLDKVDETLAQLDIYEEVAVTEKIKFEVDLRSVNALCQTIDKYEGLIKTVLFFDPLGLVLGDLKELKLSTWEEGMSRTADDRKIMAELIELVEANKFLISGVCSGQLDLGVFEDYIDLGEIFGPDGISGLLKEAIIGIVYETDSAEFTNAYNTYKNDVDAFIYGPLLTKLADEYLPGFTMDASSTIEDLICLVLEISFDEYLAEEVKKMDIDLASSDIPELKALDGIMNLKGSSYDLSVFSFDLSKSLLSQYNNLCGLIAKQVVPGYDGWVEGGYENLGSNLEGISRYICTTSGIIPQAASMSFEEIAVELIKIALKYADLGNYDIGLAECDTLEEMLTVFLRNSADELGTGIIYDEDDSYLVILGDLLAHFAYSYIDVTDLNGKSYLAGGGKDVFEVSNYIMNYFLFDKGVADILKLSTTKSETIFTKIDKLADFFGETKSKGVSFDSKKFLLGSASSKGLIESVLTLDFDNILELTIVPALETAGDVSVIEFLYKTVQYFMNNWAGKTVLPAYREKAFTNALSNESIANMISAILETVNSRKTSVIIFASFALALLLKGEDVAYNVTQADVSACDATGAVLYPDGTVKLDDKTLTKGKDYIITVNRRDPGEAVATISFIGMYSGKIERSINVKLADVGKISFLATSSTVKLQWNKVALADGYNVYLMKNGSYEKANTELITQTEFYLTKLTKATEYSVKVEAVIDGYCTSDAVEIKVATIPDSVNASTIKKLTDASRARFIWTAVAGATNYKIEKYISGKNKWEEVLVTDKTDVIVSGLESYTEYTFRISALKKTSDGGYASANPVSVIAKTTLGAITKTSVSYTANSITISWNAVKNAQAYEITQCKNGKWSHVAAFGPNTTSFKITGLKAATKYQYAVRPAVKENGKWIYGGYQIINQYTGLAKPANFKVTATNATQARIEWSKVAGAKIYQVFRYIDGKWVSLGTTSNTFAIISNLPSGTKSYFRVRGVTTVNGAYHFGDATDYVTALTIPGKVNSVKLVVRKTGSITFSWNKVAGATGYQIFRYHNGKWVSLGTTTALQYTDSKSMSKGVEYQYRVRAIQKVGSTTRYGEASPVFKAKTTLIGQATYL